MYKTKDVFELNQRVCFDLWRIAAGKLPSSLSPRLIFPEKRDLNVRISEQEARLLYCNHLNTTSYYYSIETPTQDVYQQTGIRSMSALSDLSIYLHTGQVFQKMVNIEFKAHNVGLEQIQKDINKLVKERISGNWFHTLTNVDRGTLPSLFGKFIASLKSCTPLLSKPEEGWYNDISIVFCFCVLDKKWACTKQFYYQSALERKKSFDQYVDDFFRLDYLTTKQDITVIKSNGWTFYTPEESILHETISYKVSLFQKNNYDREFQETILGSFSTLTHALSVICMHCKGQYLQVTHQDNEKAMVHVSRDDEIYHTTTWYFEESQRGYVDLPVGEEYTPFDNIYFRIEKLNN